MTGNTRGQKTAEQSLDSDNTIILAQLTQLIEVITTIRIDFNTRVKALEARFRSSSPISPTPQITTPQITTS